MNLHPRNDEVPSGRARDSQDQTQTNETNPSGESLREQGYTARLARVTARLALQGFSLYSLTGNTLLVTKWAMTRTLPSIEAAERFLLMVGGA